MKYKVLDSFKALTKEGEMELQTGQLVTLPHEKAIKLLNEGKITPVEKISYKVYSEILQGYLWVVDTDKDLHSLRSQGVSEAIYTADEIKMLQGMDKDSLRTLHRAKETFPESTIKEITKKENKHESDR